MPSHLALIDAVFIAVASVVGFGGFAVILNIAAAVMASSPMSSSSGASSCLIEFPLFKF